jgi:hypothetical protein
MPFNAISCQVVVGHTKDKANAQFEADPPLQLLPGSFSSTKYSEATEATNSHKITEIAK